MNFAEARREPSEKNRYRFWGRIEELERRMLRVVTLEGKITIHMNKDPILEELHRMREEYAARFNYDLKAMYWDLKAREERGEFLVVHCSLCPPCVQVVSKEHVTERGAA